ncbi:pentapeptide repeat-containing protein [Lachnospiraceae bacterium 46-61]
MKKEEMLQKWKKEILFTTLQHTIADLEKYLQCHIQQILKNVYCDIDAILKNIVENQNEQKVAYITFHLMRKDIIDGIYQYRVFLYDNSWYIKRGQQLGTLNSSFIYQYYDAFCKQVFQKSNEYRHYFSIPEIEMFIMQNLEVFHYYFVEILRYVMNDISESDNYYKIKKEQTLEIQSGEYYEPCDKIYQEQTEKDYGKWKRELLKQQNVIWSFEDLQGIDCNGMTAIEADFRYTNFKRSDLQYINMQNSILMGARFQYCNMMYADLKQTVLNYACFDYANLEGACFDYAITMLDNILYGMVKVKPAFYIISFQKCNLKYASLKGVVFKYADFRGADLTNADFTDAVLEQCLFSAQHMNQTHFSEQQKKQIKIV